MIRTFLLLLVLATLTRHAFAASKLDRMRSEVENLACGQFLSLGSVDYTHVPAAPALARAFKSGFLDYLSGWGDVAQGKHDAAAWNQTRREAVTTWFKYFERMREKKGWVDEYIVARNVVDDQARRVLGTVVQNKEQMLAAYRTFEAHLEHLFAESSEMLAFRSDYKARGQRELRVRLAYDYPQDEINTYLSQVTPAGGPALPAEVERLSLTSRDVRAVLANDIQFIRRLRKTSADADLDQVINARLKNTYAMLSNPKFSPARITELRRATRILSTGWEPFVPSAAPPKFTLHQREQLIADAIDLEPLAQTLLAAAVELPTAVPAPAVPQPPAKPMLINAESSAAIWMSGQTRDEVDRQNEELLAKYGRAHDEYLRQVRAYNASEAYTLAQNKLRHDHVARINARWAVVAYVAYVHRDWFADGGPGGNRNAAGALKMRLTPIITQRLADVDAEPSSEDVEHAINTVVMNHPAGESDSIRKWLRLAMVMVPSLMGDHVTDEFVPTIPGRTPTLIPEFPKLTPLEMPEGATEEPSTVPTAESALGMFPRPVKTP